MIKSITLIALLLSLTSHADEISYFANGEAGRQVSFGAGEDGAFIDGPAQTGITVVGATITFNTDVKSTYHFSSFTLSSGNTLRAVGSSPLTVRVAGVSLIQGSVSVLGLAGDNANAGAAGVGGIPGAGGGAGGTGGKEPPTSANGSDALPRSGPSVGGSTPVNEAGFTTQMAGGGGCNGTSAGAGNFATAGYRFPAGAASCSLTQAEVASRFDTIFTGGAGGGGGGTRDFLGNGMNGSGGGAGGGAFHLSSLGSITLSGTVTAVGGAGGNGNLGGGGEFGSSGGGGSGGSVWLQTAASFSGSGTLTVSGGSGGIDGTLTNDGGNGSRGAIRVDAAENLFTGTLTPSGALDAGYAVSPVTTGFDLTGGLACGTLARPLTSGESRSAFYSLFFWMILFAGLYLTVRATNRPRS